MRHQGSILPRKKLTSKVVSGTPKYGKETLNIFSIDDTSLLDGSNSSPTAPPNGNKRPEVARQKEKGGFHIIHIRITRGLLLVCTYILHKNHTKEHLFYLFI